MEEERQEQEGAAKSRKSALLPPSAAPSTAAILPDDAEAPHSSGSGESLLAAPAFPTNMLGHSFSSHVCFHAVTSSMHPKEERAGDRAVGNSGLAGDTMALQPATAKPVGIVEVKPPPAALVELRAAASESGRSASTTALDNTSSEKVQFTGVGSPFSATLRLSISLCAAL